MPFKLRNMGVNVLTDCLGNIFPFVLLAVILFQWTVFKRTTVLKKNTNGMTTINTREKDNKQQEELDFLKNKDQYSI